MSSQAPRRVAGKRQPPIEAVVIGTSAGGLAALSVLVAGLAATFRLPLLVVQHIPSGVPTQLAEIFRRKTGLHVKEADEKETVRGGTLYFAAPGYHLLVEQDASLSLSQDDSVHFSRPSIDVLFESAADGYGEKLLGVLLSGANGDGAAGLAAIHAAGGRTVVQAPSSAAMPVMPQAALARQPAHEVLTPGEIATVFAQLRTSRLP